MSYYKVCPNCGSNLDPGEKCNCESEKTIEQEKKRKFFNQYLKIEPKAGQFAFVFEEESYESKSYC